MATFHVCNFYFTDWRRRWVGSEININVFFGQPMRCDIEAVPSVCTKSTAARIQSDVQSLAEPGHMARVQSVLFINFIRCHIHISRIETTSTDQSVSSVWRPLSGFIHGVLRVNSVF